jgi:hypothetical protein
VRRAGYKRAIGLRLTAVNVDCTNYYALLVSDKSVQAADEPKGFSGAQSDSQYFGNAVFTTDVFDTVIGIENSQRTTRVAIVDGELHRACAKDCLTGNAIRTYLSSVTYRP